MSEQQYLWAPTPDKPKRGRVWLIVVLAVVALLIVGGVLWLILRPGAPDADPAATTSPSASASASPSESATPPASPSSSAQPSSRPVQTAPPAPKDPSIATFRDKVAPVLSDAHRGLQYAADETPQQAAQDVGLLQDDAGRLSDAVPPSSIATKWATALQNYSTALKNLRAAYDGGAQGTGEMAAAKKALDALDAIIN